MNRELASHLTTIVNDKALYDALLEYVNYRKELVKSNAVQAKPIDEIRAYQGAYKELCSFDTLREAVHQALKEK